MLVNILTIFPDVVKAFLFNGILKRASENNIVQFNVVDIREFTYDKHNKVDDIVYGGMSGMLFKPDVVLRALETTTSKDSKKIYMSPKGKLLDYNLINELKSEEEITILCANYEGIDQRILEVGNFEEVSIGDYVLTGGELPALTLIDSVVRMLQGVLGNEKSHDEESIYSGLLEYPQWTKPRIYEGHEVPDVLLSGDHKKIALFNYENSLKLTLEKRPDLFKKYIEKVFHKKEISLTKEQIKILKEIAKYEE